MTATSAVGFVEVCSSLPARSAVNAYRCHDGPERSVHPGQRSARRFKSERSACFRSFAKNGLLGENLAITAQKLAYGGIGFRVVAMNDDDYAVRLARDGALGITPASVRIEHRKPLRERRHDRIALEPLPIRIADFAAARDRTAEIERVADHRLLVPAAAERVFDTQIGAAAECDDER